MDVKVKLENLICSVLNIPSRSIKENERLLEDIGINSIDLIKIIVNIEKEFDFEFEDEFIGYEKIYAFGKRIARLPQRFRQYGK